MVNFIKHSTVLRLHLSTLLSSRGAEYGRTLPAFDETRFVNKGALCLLTGLCLLLTGCDSGSAASSVGLKPHADSQSINLSIKNDAATVTHEQYANPQLRTASTAPDENKTTIPADSQSLMSASNTSTGMQRTPMISEAGTDSTLKATLIGDYKGMLPCSFCDGINMTLNLLANGSVLKTSIYENPVKPTAPLIESGVYRQDDDIITVVYNDKNIDMYRIQHNHLVRLDKHKQPDADYTLSRR